MSTNVLVILCVVLLAFSLYGLTHALTVLSHQLEKLILLVEGIGEQLEDFYLPRHSGMKEARRSAEASLLQVAAHGAEAPLIAEIDAEDEYLSRWGLHVQESRLRPDHGGSEPGNA